MCEGNMSLIEKASRIIGYAQGEWYGFWKKYEYSQKEHVY
jgi:hypothetical protein